MVKIQAAKAKMAKAPTASRAKAKMAKAPTASRAKAKTVRILGSPKAPTAPTIRPNHRQRLGVELAG